MGIVGWGLGQKGEQQQQQTHTSRVLVSVAGARHAISTPGNFVYT